MEKINFKEDTFPIITKILQDNKIEESNEDILEKLSNNKPLQGQIIISAVEKIVVDGAVEKDICTFLATELNIPALTASTIYAEIISKLVPIAEKLAASEINPKIPVVRKPRIKKPLENIAPPVVQQNQGPDAYREPIE